MTRDEVLQNLRSRYGDGLIGVFDKSPSRVYIEVRADSLADMCEYLFRDAGARFNIATAVDTRERIEVLYHFIVEDANLLVTLRAGLDRDRPTMESVGARFEAANWIEREMAEMFGIEFRGHPDMRRLLLPDAWPEGVHPLRADYREWDTGAVRDRGV